ncbi:perforin-1-like isoform X1 [Bufo bufo]|uniref:perforin-1-like isoform X1 n=2 Tax=Bufo bufo TaxID=8384 RepID=UPI001ABDBB92|nr:perforin-1-like isoform X1 [Bufo bufo]XP_040296282.1 perforin-1-like isoform X1 [Bufo bufo]
MFFIFILVTSVCRALTQGPPPVTYACRSAKIQECNKVHFVPGHTLLGGGLDIVTMKKKGSYLFNLQKVITSEKTCTVCSNPYMKKAWQKLPLGVVDWKPQSTCFKKISGETSRSTSSLAEESASSIQNNWEVGLELHHKVGDAKMVLAGSQSQLAQFGQSKSSGDRYTFIRHQLSCVYYSLRLSDTARLSRDFYKSLESLPATYDMKTQEKYRHLITTYGTHYLSQANVGGEAQQVTAIRTCHATMDGVSLDELKDCLSIEASAAITGKAEANAKASTCKDLSQKSNHGENFHQMYHERIWKITGGTITFDLLSFDSKNSDSASSFEKWMESLQIHPDIVSYALEPIHNLVRFKGPQRENLKKALSDYIMEKALRQNCSCPAGSVISSGAECSCICQGNNHRNQNCCPSKKGYAKLVVTIESAANLWGDYTSKTDAFVVVSYGSARVQTPTIWNNNNPIWKSRFDLGIFELSSAPLMKIQVWDEDNKYDDDLLGTCTKNVNRGVKSEVCYLQHGSVSFVVSAECEPHLTGHLCREYAASPN